MNITNKRVFWYSFSVSLVVFLTSEWWVSSINFYLSNCITAICTFAMTFICLEHFKVDGKTKYLLVCTGVFLGRSILQIPIHKSGKTKCARFEKRNVQKSGKTKRAKKFAHTTL